MSNPSQVQSGSGLPRSSHLILHFQADELCGDERKINVEIQFRLKKEECGNGVGLSHL